jgi:hypothetical protein
MRVTLAAVSIVCLACSAIVDPDTSRLGGTQQGADGGWTADPRCPSHQTWCNGSCVSPGTDDLHCGGCGQRCAEGEECVLGACTCAAEECGPASDPCDACGAGEECDDGTCVCRDGLTEIAGVCLDLANDAENCGSAGVVCESGFCRDGRCALLCAAGLAECGGACVDLATDERNCGGCSHECGGRELCVASACRHYQRDCDDCEHRNERCCPYGDDDDDEICIRSPSCP